MATHTNSPIRDFMAGIGDDGEKEGRNILVSGATGFLGMALIEKLLRTCPGVGTIYVLVRPKKGKEPKARAEDLSKNLYYSMEKSSNKRLHLLEALEGIAKGCAGNEALILVAVSRHDNIISLENLSSSTCKTATSLVYERLHEECPGVFEKKVRAIYGDIGVEGLGLSSEDLTLLCQNVSVVFHSAATLDFESGLKLTTDVNLLGTRRLLELAKKMPKLKVFLHVSSAFVNCIRQSAEEKLYPIEQSADKLIALSSSMEEKAFEEIAPTLMGDHPNTYTFTKALAEYEVNSCKDLFPVVIVRPSMITGAWKEPKPGWISSMNGPAGFLTGAAKGVLRRLPLDHNLVTDYIPVDSVVSVMITAAWHTATTKPKDMPIYHCTTSTINPFRWKQIEHRVDYYLHLYPLKSAVWYPNLKFLPSLILFQISSIFIHFIPGFFLDLLARLVGGRPILIKLHTRVNSSLGRLKFFIFNEWFFDNKQTLWLANQLSPQDEKIFSEINIERLNWEIYFDNFVRGVRRYNNKEGLETLPAARKKDKRLYVYHLLLQGTLYLIFWWLTAKTLGMTMTATLWVLPCLFVIFFLL